MNTIDARDLCVGSYVHVAGHGRDIYTVRNLSNGSLYCNTDDGKFFTGSIVFIDPIPLTRSWAKNLGFTSVLGIGVRAMPDAKSEMVLEGTNEDFSLWNGNRLCEVQSIHHLQALVWQLERVWLTLPTP